MKHWRDYFDRPAPKPVQKVNDLSIDECTKAELAEEIRRLGVENRRLQKKVTAVRDLVWGN